MATVLIVIVAELEICHSRPIAPTRRVGLANQTLPIGPGPGLGGVLLAGIVANSVREVDAEDRAALFELFDNICNGVDITQPTVRHRFQDDLIGLTVSRQQLVSVDGRFEFRLDTTVASPVQLVLGALYAVGRLPAEARVEVAKSLRVAWLWDGLLNVAFIDCVLNQNSDGFVSHQDFSAWNDPVGWALDVLSMSEEDVFPTKRAVQKRFRDLVRQAHPDHGAVRQGAAVKIKQLTDARDILVAEA